MALSKYYWTYQCHCLLESAAEEFAKQKFAKIVGYKEYNWGENAKHLIGCIDKYFRSKTYRKFDRSRAFLDAYHGACGNHVSSEAKWFMLHHCKLTKVQKKKVADTFLFTEDLISEMLKKYAPRLTRLIPKE